MPSSTVNHDVDGAEVARNNTPKSCWLVIEGKVYNVTSYLADHPGGAAMLLNQGGKDATSEFKQVHSSDMVQNLPPGSLIGTLNPTTASSLLSSSSSSSSFASSSSSSFSITTTHITQCVRVTDFEEPAKRILPHRTWVYISSSANGGISLARNLASWERLSFRPRILRDVGGPISTATRILGRPSPVPFYIPPMGNHAQMHPGAEPEMTRGAFRSSTGMHHVVSTSSSVSRHAIARVLHEQEFTTTSDPSSSSSSSSTATLHFQLYVPTDRNKARAIVRQAREAGYASLWITADTAVLGKRTADRRLQADEALGMGLEDVAAVNMKHKKENLGGRPPSGMIDAGLNWKDLEWIRDEWGAEKPIVIKGIQTAEDVKMAALEYGCAGVVLSNHGGRQMGNAPSGLETLLEVRRDCPEVLNGKFQIFLDGGLRDGADVLKAVALGATAVGVGRPFLYALAAYGAEGVQRCYEILTEELILGMRLLGVTSLHQLTPAHVNATSMINEMWRRPETSLL